MPLMRRLKSLALTAGALLTGFHGWLLATQIADGRVIDPWVSLRWILAAGLVAGLVWIHQQGASIVGRKSVAIWVLAALLHGPAFASKFGGLVEITALPEVVVTVVVRVAAIALTAIGLWILAGLLARSLQRPRAVLAGVVARRPKNIVGVGHSSRFSPRPPPKNS